MVAVILCKTMTIQGGYKVMSLNKRKRLTIKNNMIHELPLLDNVNDRSDQLVESEGAMKYLEFNEQYDNKTEQY